MNFDRQYWDNLRVKYKADGETETSPILEMILAKAELSIPLINFEEKWLESQGFSTTLQIIQEERKYRSKLPLRLQENFTELSLKYKAPCSSSWRDNPLYYILLKINLEESLTDSEINWLKKQPRTDISRLAEIDQFVNLKSKYQIINRPDLSLDSSLNQILKKLDLAERLTDKEVDYLNRKKFEYALKIFQEQEVSREVDFARLKDKYQATSYPEASISNPLYNILKKIDTLIVLTDSETEYLINNQLIATHFAALKIKYKATSFEDLSPNSHFYKILKKLESKAFPVPEPDINFLKKRKLNDTLNIYIGEYSTILAAKINSKEQLNDAEIEWLKQNVPQIYFSILKSKYDVSAYQNNSPDSPLYEILQKLEKGIRLDAINVAFLRETKIKPPKNSNRYYWSENDYDENNGGWHLFRGRGKIYLTYHTIEALFYEEEYKQNGNQWNLPSISSHWRKAEKPKRALKITDNLNFEKSKKTN
jgi:hypothetical protein